MIPHFFSPLRGLLTLTLPGPSAGVSGSLDSYCSLKPLCSGMGEVVPARTSPTLLPPSPRTVLSLSCFKVSQCMTSTVRVNANSPLYSFCAGGSKCVTDTQLYAKTIPVCICLIQWTEKISWTKLTVSDPEQDLKMSVSPQQICKWLRYG